MINSKEERHGLSECPYEFYREWIADPEAARAKVEAITRQSVGTDECPIEGIPVAGKANKPTKLTEAA